MVDDADKAAELSDAYLREAKGFRRAEVDAADGTCLNCEAKIPSTHRWCDADCRDDYLRANRLDRRETVPADNSKIMVRMPCYGADDEDV